MKQFFIIVLSIVSMFAKAASDRAAHAGESQWPQTFRRGISEGCCVALTFDDAPSARTMQLLDTLSELNVKATFFVVGSFANSRPDLLIEIANRGHELANHTWDHPNITRLSEGALVSQIQRTNELIERLTGVTPRLFRPPGGSHSQREVNIVFQNRMTTVMWDVDCRDYSHRNAQYIQSRVLESVRPGSIVLLHDHVAETRDALTAIVTTLRSRGYTFVTVGQMIEMQYGSCQWDESYGREEKEEESRGVF